jgi:predicted CXXCH cytochrome family protein
MPSNLLPGALLAICLLTPVCGENDSAKLCAPCHRGVWETYQRTAMARSFYPAAPQNMVEDFNATYFHQPSNSYFTMLQRGGKYFQKRYQLAAGGRTPINVVEKQVDYVMGSGNHARTYLHRTPANTLIELPLGWYAEKGGYFAMNPGYDRPDHEGFRRPISYDCMFCHNAYPGTPAVPSSTQSVYIGALPEGIDCQRCHGSGAKHAALAGTAGVKPGDIRAAIVNPARLTPDRQMEVCMACHLESTSFPLPNALQRFDRGPFSYRPGEPLADFILNFDHAPSAGRQDKFEIVNAAYRLRRSACFLKGKLLCTTCHNPHGAPRGEAAEQHYAKVCLQCHAAALDQKTHTSTTGCVTCHMPKRRTEDVIHVAVTDHFIQRRLPPGDLLAERTERRDSYRGPVVLYYPETLPRTLENELYLALAQVKQGSNSAVGIPQLAAAVRKYSPPKAEWYLELGEAFERDGQWTKAVPEFRQAAARDPKLGLPKLGTALRRSGQPAEAIEVLKKAPISAVTSHELGLAYQALGRGKDAVAEIDKALKLDPDWPEAHNNLGSIWLTAGYPAQAEPEFREAIRLKPDYADAHANLAGVLSGAGKIDEARAEFEAALRLRPSDAPTRYNYAEMLVRTNHLEEAHRELEASLKADSHFPDAHLLLADLLLAGGKAQQAIPHYNEALRALPDSARGHLGLGAALASTGDIANAIPHLDKASASPDPPIRGQATQILRQLKGIR